jgi:hypothetical protein
MKPVRAVVWTFVLLAAVLVGGGLWITQPLFSVPRPAPPRRRADPARLERDVRRLVQEFSPRDFTHPENLQRAARWIANELGSSGGRVEEQPFGAGGESYRNVLASFGPEGPERIVIGAHFDTDGPLPGADDNASGVAALLELARLLRGENPPTRVELAAYALEEMPFFGSRQMGSAVHARALASAGARVRAMFSLEMVGFFSEERGSQGFPFSVLRLLYPDRGNFIAVVGRTRDGLLVRRVKRSMRSGSDLPVHSIAAPRAVPGLDLSDHASYWDAGYPAVMITDTAFYRNDRYHTERDTPDSLDYGRMAKVVDGLLEAVRDLAEK